MKKKKKKLLLAINFKLATLYDQLMVEKNLLESIHSQKNTSLLTIGKEIAQWEKKHLHFVLRKYSLLECIFFYSLYI